MHFIDVNTLLISKSCVCSSVVVFTNIRMTMANANTDDFSGYDSEATEAVSNEQSRFLAIVADFCLLCKISTPVMVKNIMQLR
jgi:hypothetical protein